MLTVHTGNSNSLGNIAVEAQTGLANATLINKTLDLLNGQGSSASGASLEALGETTKNMVNAAMGKGLNLDAMA